MKPAFRSWVSPTDKDSELTRQQSLLNLTLLGLSVTGLLLGSAMAVLWLQGRIESLPGIVVGWVLQPFLLLAYWLGRRGRVRLASLVTVGGIFCVMVGVNYFLGLGHAIWIGYAVVTLTAGMLIGTEGALAFALLSMIAYLGVGALQIVGVLPTWPPGARLVVDGVGLGLGLILLVGLNWLSNRQTNQSLRREMALTAQLRTHQAALEGRVAGRTAELTAANQQLRQEIEERERAETALQESTAKYRQLVDHAPAGIYEVDFQANRFTSVNDIMCEYTGYTREEFLALTPLDLLTEESQQRFLERALKMQAGEPVPETVEYAIRTKDGRELWVILNTRLTRDGQVPPGATVVVHNITERKRAAEQVQRLLDQQIAINRLSLALGETRDLARINRIIYEHVCELMDAHAFIVSFYEGETQLIHAAYVISGGVERDVTGFPPIPLEAEGHGTQSRVIRSGQPLYVPDFRQAMARTRTEHTIVENGSTVEGPPPPERKKESTNSALLVPMKVAGKTIGVVQVQSHQLDAYSQADMDLLSGLANVAALAIENTRLFEAARYQAEQLETLQHYTQELVVLRDQEDLLRHIVELATALVGGDSGGLYVYRPERDVLEWTMAVGAHMAPIGMVLHRGEGLSGQVWESGEPLAVNDYRLWEGRAAVYEGYSFGATVGVPVRWGDQFLGVLDVLAEPPRTFSSTDVKLLNLFATQAAIALQNVRLYDGERISRERAEALRQAAQAMGASLEFEASLRLILQQLKRVITFDTASLLILQEDNSPDLVVGLGYTDERMTSRESRRLLENSPILAQMSHDLRPVVSGDVRELEGWIWVPGAEHVRSWIGVPLAAEGKMIGALMADNTATDFFTTEDVQITQALAQHAAQVIEKARLFEALQRHAERLEERVVGRTRDLAAANERLKELDRLKSKFVSDVSHELRTPITNIKLYLHLLARDQAANWPKHLAVLDDESDRLARLIEDILNLSRLDLAREKMERVAVDLNRVVGQVVLAHRPRAEAAGLELGFEPDEALPPVWGEPNQLEQVVTNLVINAINYTPAGYVRLRTGLSWDNRQACLEVQDSGMGIEPEDRPHLFERFYRGKRVGSSNIPGTGLGLAIVQEIVDLHRGKIDVESQPDRGSTFKIFLPLVERERKEQV
ncbi:MAG: GAF domain-containing protein [Chloroflexota bacterium]